MSDEIQIFRDENIRLLRENSQLQQNIIELTAQLQSGTKPVSAFSDWLASAAWKNWKTSALGALTSAGMLIVPSIQAGQWPSKSQWGAAALAFAYGLVSKDSGVTGK